MPYEMNTRARVNHALRNYQAPASVPGAGSIYPAVVLAENGGGYDVQTVDAAGRAGRAFNRIHTFPADTTVAADDEVWVWVPDDGEEALILVAGGSGGCSRAVTDMGVLFS